MAEPVFLLSLCIIFVGPLVSVCLAILVMKNRDQDLRSTFETRRMFFAAAVLLGIGFLFFEGMILHYYDTDTNTRGTEIFDTCKTVLPPIITLILGYFFGATSTVNGSNQTSSESKKTS